MIYNIGVIGTGIMGTNHTRVIKSMADKFNLIGIYDVNSDNASEVANLYNTQYFKELDDLLCKVDAIIIAVPSSFHKEIAIECINRNINLLIEKPLALEVSDAMEILDALEGKDLVGMVGHIERYNPVTIELMKILSSEEVLTFDIHRLSPYDQRIFDTDVILDLMIHDIDLLSEFIEDDIIDIKSMGISVYSNTYDYVQASIRYKENKIASLIASRITEDKKRMIEVNTKESYIVADYLNRGINITRKTKFSLDVGYATKYKQENITEKVFIPMIEPLLAELEHFYDCILNKGTPKTSIANSLKVLKISKEIASKIGE